MIPPQPGDFAVVRMNGATGRLIRLGQWLNGDGFADYEHAFVYIGDGLVVEAEPGGARRGSLGYYAHAPMLWSTGRIALTDGQRATVVAAALGYVGVPYSFVDYLSIMALRFRLPVPWLHRYVANSGHMICSQLVDQCYQDAGIRLFPDGRWPGDVTPGDLYRLIVKGSHDERSRTRAV